MKILDELMTLPFMTRWVDTSHCRLWLLLPERIFLNNTFLTQINVKEKYIELKVRFQNLPLLEKVKTRACFQVLYADAGDPSYYENGVAIAEFPNADRVAFDIQDMTVEQPMDSKLVTARMIYECDILFNYDLLKKQ